MVGLLVFGLLIVSLPVYRPHLRIAAILDLVVVLLLFYFRVLPGSALFVDWVMATAFLLDGSIFFFMGREILA